MSNEIDTTEGVCEKMHNARNMEIVTRIWKFSLTSSSCKFMKNYTQYARKIFPYLLWHNLSLAFQTRSSRLLNNNRSNFISRDDARNDSSR